MLKELNYDGLIELLDNQLNLAVTPTEIRSGEGWHQCIGFNPRSIDDFVEYDTTQKSSVWIKLSRQYDHKRTNTVQVEIIKHFLDYAYIKLSSEKSGKELESTFDNFVYLYSSGILKLVVEYLENPENYGKELQLDEAKKALSEPGEDAGNISLFVQILNVVLNAKIKNTSFACTGGAD
jgi:hypothetical protein